MSGHPLPCGTVPQRFYRSLLLVLASVWCLPVQSGPGSSAEADLVSHGRYLARIAGCNDCHTPGYAVSGGNVPEDLWLTGDAVGWRGPWGTTYASNLRLALQNLTETQWLSVARNAQYQPPMPWFALRDMSDHDLRAIYHFVKHKGPAGQPAPAYVPPDQVPGGPYVQFPAPPVQ